MSPSSSVMRCGPRSARASSGLAPAVTSANRTIVRTQTLLDLARLASAAEAAADERVSWEMATAGDRAAWIAAGRHVTFSPATLHTTNICDNDQCTRTVFRSQPPVFRSRRFHTAELRR